MAYGIITNGKQLGGINSPSLLVNLVDPYMNGDGEFRFTHPSYRAGNPVFCVGSTGSIFGSSTISASYGGINWWGTSGNEIILKSDRMKNTSLFNTNFSVYQVQRPENVSDSYGIMIQDSVNWLSFNSEQNLGYVAWQGDVNINDQWSLPTVQNDNTKIVFARCDDPEVCVGHVPEYNKIYVSRDNGSGEPQPTTATVRILIVNSGYYPPTPSGYGLVIKNAAGQNTFTSDSNPLVWDGLQTAVQRVPYDISWTGIQRPMIPLPTCGFFRGNSEMNGGRYNFHQNGFRFATGGGFQYWRSRGRTVIQSTSSTDFDAGQIPLMVINSDNYF